MKVIKKSGFAKKAAAFTLSAAMITSAFSGLSAVNSEQSKVEAAAIVDNGLRTIFSGRRYSSLLELVL